MASVKALVELQQRLWDGCWRYTDAVVIFEGYLKCARISFTEIYICNENIYFFSCSSRPIDAPLISR